MFSSISKNGSTFFPNLDKPEPTPAKVLSTIPPTALPNRLATKDPIAVPSLPSTSIILSMNSLEPGIAATIAPTTRIIADTIPRIDNIDAAPLAAAVATGLT